MTQGPREKSVNRPHLIDLAPVPDASSTNMVNHLPKPNADQRAFQDLELGLFIHFGMNTFTGETTGGKGSHPPAMFNPTALNCDNWMQVAQAMGARFAVLTARHEEGFCLWPTQTTDYCIRQSPYQGGRGDVVREFVTACRRHDIKPCLYHSSYMDARHIFQDGDPIQWHEEWFQSTKQRLAEPGAAERFTQMQVSQVRELLTQYGDITYLWLDHIGETQGILDPAAVDSFWSAIVAEARARQPHCLLLKADIYLSRDRAAGGGVHGGRAANPLWYACRRENTREGQGDPIPDPAQGNQYIVWEANTIFSGSWFWNGPAVKPVAEMIEHYYATVGRGATFLPNFAPDPRGLMTEQVLAHAQAFGKRVRQLSENPLGEMNGMGPALELELPGETTVDHVVTMEDLREGQKIRAYSIEAREPGGAWTRIVTGQSVGHKRIDRFAPIRTDALRFSCLQSLAEPIGIRRFAAYCLSTSGDPIQPLPAAPDSPV